MSVYGIEPASLHGLRTYPLASRSSKVRVSQFARAHRRGTSFANFLESLPHILAAESLRELVKRIIRARTRRAAILWGLGGHVIKVGLGPILIDLMRRGYVSGLAMTGAALIHDLEIALVGRTSEDVEAQLARGKFGMADETSRYVNEMAAGAARSEIGLGEGAGKLLTHPRLRAKFLEQSVVAAAYQARVPVTIHVAIGADIPHMHPSADGALLGAATHHDFRLFCALVKQMNRGGVYLNWGSAVILPEVFLKAVSVASNQGAALRGITTANFDFIQQYRAQQNVVRRPTAGRAESKGYAITGHHEILMPLVAAALIEAGSRERNQTPLARARARREVQRHIPRPIHRQRRRR